HFSAFPTSSVSGATRAAMWRNAPYFSVFWFCFWNWRNARGCYAQRAVLGCLGQVVSGSGATRRGCCATRSVLVPGLTFVDF
ncbi:hypothetical protein A2U01_0068633, partial [Trifolium medium]|nr:hypothetical protein [Trifolium medium]